MTLTQLAHIFEKRNALLGSHTLVEYAFTGGSPDPRYIIYLRRADRWAQYSSTMGKNQAFLEFLAMENDKNHHHFTVLGWRSASKPLPDMGFDDHEVMGFEMLDAKPGLMDVVADVIARGG